jgi:hypothetical protein
MARGSLRSFLRTTEAGLLGQLEDLCEENGLPIMAPDALLLEVMEGRHRQVSPAQRNFLRELSLTLEAVRDLRAAGEKAYAALRRVV